MDENELNNIYNKLMFNLRKIVEEAEYDINHAKIKGRIKKK
ncbi:MAG: hypothetical protein AABX19_03560 [Nanoarchaeota archaeon]